MEHYRKSSHAIYDIKYHIVWITKYRKSVMTGKIASKTRELIQQYWGRHLWGRGYFVASSGNVTDEVIMEYIRTREVEELKTSDNASQNAKNFNPLLYSFKYHTLSEHIGELGKSNW